MGFLKNLNKTIKLPEYTLGLKTSAIYEIMVIIATALIFNLVLGDGNRFNDIYPHPFSYLLLIIVVQYGANEGFFCILIMTLTIYLGNMPEQKISQNNYDYWIEVSKQPIMWIMVNLFIGGLSRKKNTLIKFMKENINELKEQSDIIARSYEKLQDRNRMLELKIAGELSSVIKVFDAAKSLATMHKDNYTSSVSDIIKVVLEPEKFSIYLLENNLLKLISYSGVEENHMKKSYSAETPLYKQVVINKKMVNCLKASDAVYLPSPSVAAVPLVDHATGSCVGMLKIDEIEFSRMNLRWLKLLHLVAGWVGSSLYSMDQILHARGNTITSSASQMYTDSFLKRQSEFLTELGKRLHFQLTKVSITVPEMAQLTDQERHLIACGMNKAITEALRSVDQIFETKGEILFFTLLLPGTPEENAHIVIDKIHKKLNSFPRNYNHIQYRFSIEALVTENDYYYFHK